MLKFAVRLEIARGPSGDVRNFVARKNKEGEKSSPNFQLSQVDVVRRYVNEIRDVAYHLR
jgi:hypothetical protein